MRRHACERTREWLCLELDGELSRFERALADRHVAGCSACARFGADVRAFTGMLRATPLEPLERPVTVRVPRRLPFASLQAVAAVFAVVAVGVSSLSTALSSRDDSRRRVAAPLTTMEMRDALRLRQHQVLTERLDAIRGNDRPPREQQII